MQIILPQVAASRGLETACSADKGRDDGRKRWSTPNLTRETIADAAVGAGSTGADDTFFS